MLRGRARIHPRGVPGPETMLPLLLTAVAEERLTLERLVELAVRRHPSGMVHTPTRDCRIDPGAAPGHYILSLKASEAGLSEVQSHEEESQQRSQHAHCKGCRQRICDRPSRESSQGR